MDSKQNAYTPDLLQTGKCCCEVTESVTLKSGLKYLRGTVLGKITASGKYKPVTVAAADGSQNAAAILLNPVTVGASDVTAVVIARDAIVSNQGLTYGSDVDTAPERAALTFSALTISKLIAVSPPDMPAKKADNISIRKRTR